MTKYLALAFYKLYGSARYYRSGITEYIKDGKAYKLPYRVYRVSRLIPSWAGGQTFGNYVFLREDVTESLLAHELVHVGQYAHYAPFFPLLYLWAILRYGYAGNPFEREARLMGIREQNGGDHA